MIISCKILLHNDKKRAMPADFGKTIKPIPVTDIVIKVDVAPIKTILSTDSEIMNSVF